MTKPADSDQIAKAREQRVKAFVYHGHTTSSICPSQSWVEEFAIAFAASERQAVKEECCRAVCSECRKGDVPERFYVGSEGGWYHTMLGFDDRTERCAATAIRSMSETSKEGETNDE